MSAPVDGAASGQGPFSGVFHLRVTPAGPLGDQAVDDLRETVAGFFSAVSLGAFGPARLDPPTIETSAEGGLGARAPVWDLAAEAFPVLNGMLLAYSDLTAPLADTRAWIDPHSGTNLLDLSAGPPTGPVTPPFAIEINERPGGSTPPTAISIEFTHPISDEFADRVEAGLRAWECLLNGGFPPPGYPPGQSIAMWLDIRLDSPTTLRAASEAWGVHDACFGPLAHMLIRWGEDNQVRSLIVE